MGAPLPTSLAGSQTSVRDRVRAERLQVLFRQAPPAIFISVLVGGMVCAVLWEVVDHSRLQAWLATLAVIALIRGTLAVAYYRASPGAATARSWERWFVATALLVGAVWGTGGWVLMPATSLAHQAMLYFFLMGLAGGTVATYGAHVGLVSTSISLVILPATIRLFMLPGAERHLMAVGGLIYMGASYRATGLLAFFLRRSFQLSQELSIAHARAQELARTDELTGMNNRRAFIAAADQSLQQAIRYGRPLSLILLDVDRFKAINDGWGHIAGDDVLRTLAAIVESTIRLSDVAGRLGGEEFAILLPETNAADAMVMAERLRAGFAATVGHGHMPASIGFTASFGVAERGDARESVDGLMARADEALYRAKREGRNRVQLSTASGDGYPAPPHSETDEAARRGLGEGRL